MWLVVVVACSSVGVVQNKGKQKDKLLHFMSGLFPVLQEEDT